MSGWSIGKIVAGIVGGVCTVVEIVCAFKTTDEDDNRLMDKLADKYGLEEREQ